MKDYIGKITDDAKMSCSRLPALMGKSNWSTPNDELRKSIRANDGEKRSDFAPSEQAAWGNVHEGAILNEMVNRLKVRNAELEITEPLIHPTVQLEGSLDGRADGNDLTFTTDIKSGIYVVGQDQITLHGPGVLEAKSTNAFAEEQPADYRGPLQVQGLMACGQYKWAAIGVLYQGSKLRIFLYEPEPAIIKKIEDDVCDFQRRIDMYGETGELESYPVFSANDAAETFANLETEKTIDLDDITSELVEDLAAAQQAKKSVTKLIGELQTSIMQAMGPHEKAYVRDEDGSVLTEVTWGMSSGRKEYTVAARPASRSKSLRLKEFSDAK
jgi:hypothetical protein